MNSENTIRICGSITKIESLVPITTNILEETWVAEANLPYSNYYGLIPEKTKANSLFLFTNLYYPLEKILRFSQNIKDCYSKEIDVASAIFEFQNKQYPAIRVKNFPDYKNLNLLQSCFTMQGVSFAQKVHFINEAKATINKCFEMKKIDDGIYSDVQDSNKGYLLENNLDFDNFNAIVVNIKNNSNCRYFDAVPGIYILDFQAKYFIRIYSDGLNSDVLKCIKYQFQKNKIIAKAKTF